MTNTQLADEMLLLQQKGCHNINLVTPSHFLPQILEALLVAIERGLKLPIVYNTSGYESPETLKLLDGIVDIYLPDIKYANNNYSKKYSSCNDYSEHNRRALREMWRQVGPLITDEHGIAVQGMIVRHLVLPESIAGTIESIQWMASELSGEVAISLMAQYNPLHNSADFPEINRRISREEYFSAVGALHEAGLGEGWIQDWEGMDGRYIIDFLKRKRERLQ
jgi:putative pyruvate formate lyase activating enzyme